MPASKSTRPHGRSLRSVPSSRSTISEQFAAVADATFSAAFEEMWRISLRDNPNGHLVPFVKDHLRAMRDCLEERERAWDAQRSIESRRQDQEARS